MSSEPTKELVLPGTGGFAAIRPLKGRDYAALQARDQNACPDIFLFLMTRCVLIEGKEVTYQEFLDMDFRDVSILAAEVGKYFVGPAR